MTHQELVNRIKGLKISPKFTFLTAFYIENLERIDSVCKGIPEYLKSAGNNSGTNYSEKIQGAFQSPEDILNNYTEVFDFVLVGVINKEIGKSVYSASKTFDHLVQSMMQSDSNFPRAFYGQYPAIGNIIENITTNAIANIRKIASRITADFNDINKMFGNNQLKKLKSIKSSGNDLHKGGQQVMFLTFETLQGKPVKVVYKPSDLEFDCRFLGDTQALNAVNPSFFDGTMSLYDMMNEVITSTSAMQSYKKMATYKILPKNEGSKLLSTNGKRSIRNSYGYIEFLTSDVDRDERGTLTKFLYLISRRDMQSVRAYSDYNIRTFENVGKIESDFYNQIGKMIFLASLFSMTDVHVENLLVHKRTPYFIDLENSIFKKIDFDLLGLFQTLMLDPSYGSVTSYILTFEDRIEIYRRDPNAKEQIIVLNKQENLKDEYYRNRLFSDGNLINPKDHTAAIKQGVTQAVQIIKKLHTDNSLLGWISKLKATIVRHVIQATNNYINFRSTITDLNSTFVNRDQHKPILYDKCSEEFKRFTQSANSDNGFDFMGFFPDNVLDDFLDGDIPIFYSPVSENILLDSRGEVVKLPDSIINFTDFDNQPTELNMTLNEVNRLLENAKRPIHTRREQFLSRIPINHIEEKLNTIKELNSIGKETIDDFVDLLMGNIIKQLNIPL